MKKILLFVLMASLLGLCVACSQSSEQGAITNQPTEEPDYSPREMSFENVPVTIVGKDALTDKSLMITDNLNDLLSSVKVVANVPLKQVPYVDASVYDLHVDLSEIDAVGEYELKIVYKQLDPDYGRVISVSPEFVTVHAVEYVSYPDVFFAEQMIGIQPPAEWKVVDCKIIPESVTVSGPASVVNEIYDCVLAVMDPADWKEGDVRFPAEIRLYNRNYERVTDPLVEIFANGKAVDTVSVSLTITGKSCCWLNWRGVSYVLNQNMKVVAETEDSTVVPALPMLKGLNIETGMMQGMTMELESEDQRQAFHHLFSALLNADCVGQISEVDLTEPGSVLLKTTDGCYVYFGDCRGETPETNRISDKVSNMMSLMEGLSGQDGSAYLNVSDPDHPSVDSVSYELGDNPQQEISVSPQPEEEPADTSDSVSSDSLWQQGEAFLTQGEVQEAIRCFEQARAKNEKEGLIYINGLLQLGGAYEMLGMTDEAKAQYEALYTAVPSLAEAYKGHIRILQSGLKDGDLAKAAELMKQAYESTGDTSFLNQRADFLPHSPEADLVPGYYEEKKNITLSSDQDFDIYYTFDKSAILPTDGIQYSEPVLLGEGIHNLRAVCVNGELVSDELRGTYKIIMPRPKMPRASLAPGTYKTKQSVSLMPGKDNMQDDDIVIYYTIDGTPPNITSPVYDGNAIQLPSGYVTLRAVAVNRYQKVSNELEIHYRIDAEPEPTPASISDDSAKDWETRLMYFLQMWNRNELESMLTLCAPSWSVNQENPKAALFGILQNRTPLSVQIEEYRLSGDSGMDVTVTSEIDRHNGKPTSSLQMVIHMVIEDDQWYVAPESLRAYEVAETPEPEPTSTPGPSPVAVDDATMLYYNPNGGMYYHKDPYCICVHSKYLSLEGKFTYGQVNDEPYASLEPCNVCGAPLR